MSWKHACAIALGMFALACSGGDTLAAKSSQNIDHQATPSPRDETITTTTGVLYSVDRAADFDHAALPQNNDLRMANGDITKYATEECGLDTRPQFAPVKCDVYVQADRSGTLIGYLFLIEEGNGVRFQTATTLNEQEQPGGKCFISGTLYELGSGYDVPLKDMRRDFKAQMLWYTTTNAAGATLVSQVEGNHDGDGPHGMWYLTKAGDKFRIEQERWNYCYDNEKVVVDDVFYRAVALTRR